MFRLQMATFQGAAVGASMAIMDPGSCVLAGSSERPQR
jgi:hypothetical protein